MAPLLAFCIKKIKWTFKTGHHRIREKLNAKINYIASVHLINEETITAIKEAKEGKNVIKHASSKDLLGCPEKTEYIVR